MATLAHTRPAPRPRDRAYSPLPHPSWLHGEQRPQPDSALTARDFWERLGL